MVDVDSRLLYLQDETVDLYDDAIRGKKRSGRRKQVNCGLTRITWLKILILGRNPNSDPKTDNVLYYS